MIKLILKVLLIAGIYYCAGRLLFLEEIQQKHDERVQCVIKSLTLSAILISTFALMSMANFYSGGVEALIKDNKIGPGVLKTIALVCFTWQWCLSGFRIRLKDDRWKIGNIVAKTSSVLSLIICLALNKPATNIIFFIISCGCFTLLIVEAILVFTGREAAEYVNH